MLPGTSRRAFACSHPARGIFPPCCTGLLCEGNPAFAVHLITPKCQVPTKNTQNIKNKAELGSDVRVMPVQKGWRIHTSALTLVALYKFCLAMGHTVICGMGMLKRLFQVVCKMLSDGICFSAPQHVPLQRLIRAKYIDCLHHLSWSSSK